MNKSAEILEFVNNQNDIVKEAFELEKNALIETLLRGSKVGFNRIVKGKAAAQTAADAFDMSMGRMAKAERESIYSGMKIPGKIKKKLWGEKDIPVISEAGRRIENAGERALGPVDRFRKLIEKVHIDTQVPTRNIKINTQERDLGKFKNLVRAATRTPLSAAPGIALDAIPTPVTAFAAHAAGVLSPEAASTYAAAAHLPGTHTLALAPLTAVADRAGRVLTSKAFGIKNRSYHHIDKMIQAEDLAGKAGANVIEKGPAYAATHKKMLATIRDANKQLRD